MGFHDTPIAEVPFEQKTEVPEKHTHKTIGLASPEGGGRDAARRQRADVKKESGIEQTQKQSISSLIRDKKCCDFCFTEEEEDLHRRSDDTTQTRAILQSDRQVTSWKYLSTAWHCLHGPLAATSAATAMPSSTNSANDREDPRDCNPMFKRLPAEVVGESQRWALGSTGW
eukprot:s507_g4.t1